MQENSQKEPATVIKLPKCDWYHVKFMIRIFAAEALGLGMISFVLAVHSASGDLKSDVARPFVVGCAFAIAVWTVGPVSGPHITPVNTVALLMTRRANFVFCFLAVFGQSTGSLVGISLASRLVPQLAERTDLNQHAPKSNVTDAQAFALECACSFLLCMTSLSSLDEFRDPHWSRRRRSAFPLVVFLTLLRLAAVLAKTTGSGMNPSASIAGAIYNRKFHKLWIYVAAPSCGSIIAVLLWEMLISHGASLKRLKHWWTDRNFDRQNDYKRSTEEPTSQTER